MKAVIFDMDGVLYDSMPAHDKSWQQTMDELNLRHEPNEFYLHEGRIGKSTIDIIFKGTCSVMQQRRKRREFTPVNRNCSNNITAGQP